MRNVSVLQMTQREILLMSQEITPLDTGGYPSLIRPSIQDNKGHGN